MKNKTGTVLGSQSAEITLDDAEVMQDPGPSNYKKLIEAALALQPNQIDEMETIVAEAAMLKPTRQSAVLRAIKDATGTPLGTLRAQAKQESAYSGVIRPVFPKVSGHPFRFYPATDSGASGHPVM